MVSKIFVALIAVCTVGMALITGYSWSWLQSIGQPAAAIAGFEYHAALSWPLLWISWIALLMLGNAVLWTTRRSWAIWLSLVYFVVWIAVRSFWLEPARSSFASNSGIPATPIMVGPLLSLVLIFVAGAVTFFDQFLADRMHQKMYESYLPDVAPNSPTDAASEPRDLG